MKKGFTLMEMLAVILVIAVIVSMAAPVFRSVRYEVRNSQAKAAAKKMAEAMKSFYQASRGQKIASSKACFSPAALTVGSCMFSGATGIPAGAASSSADVRDLFACGFLSQKDFKGVPYEFCSNYSASVPSGFPTIGSGVASGKVLVAVRGLDDAGSKYGKNKGFIFVDETLSVKDTYND